MIGVTRDDAGGAPQLFGEHRARQQVRPSCTAEGEQQVRLLALGLAMPVGGTDQETRLANPAIAPLAKNFGKLFGGKIAPLLVERDGPVACFDGLKCRWDIQVQNFVEAKVVVDGKAHPETVYVATPRPVQPARIVKPAMEQ